MRAPANGRKVAGSQFGSFCPKQQLLLKCTVRPYAVGRQPLDPNILNIFAFRGDSPDGNAARFQEICGLLSPFVRLHFPGPESSKLVVVECKGCHENIPAPVEGVPAQPIAARCPLCHEHRRYLPSEVFLGRLSHLMIRKPVRTADGRLG